MQTGLRIIEEAPPDWHGYETVPIAYRSDSRIDLGRLRRGELVEISTEPFEKDYDVYTEERPSSLPLRFDTSNWGVLTAWIVAERAGGAIIAWNSPGYEMLEGREDMAVLVDIRVQPHLRGHGVGASLARRAIEWVQARGCRLLIVETQDTNPAACKFYSSLGFAVAASEEEAYGQDVAEAKIIWLQETASRY